MTRASANRLTPAVSSWARAKLSRVDQVTGLVEPAPHELRHAVDPRRVVEGHHEDAEEHHRGNRADPVEVHRREAVLGSVRGHAQDLDGAQVGRDEREPRHPGRQGAPGEEEVLAGGDRSSCQDADADDEDEVDGEDDEVEGTEVQAQVVRRCKAVHGPPPRARERGYDAPLHREARPAGDQSQHEPPCDDHDWAGVFARASDGSTAGRRELVDRRGRPVEQALPHLAAVLDQRPGLLLGLDTLGDDA